MENINKHSFRNKKQRRNNLKTCAFFGIYGCSCCSPEVRLNNKTQDSNNGEMNTKGKLEIVPSTSTDTSRVVVEFTVINVKTELENLPATSTEINRNISEFVTDVKTEQFDRNYEMIKSERDTASPEEEIDVVNDFPETFSTHGQQSETSDSREISTVTVDSSFIVNATATTDTRETSTRTIDSSFIGNTTETIENHESSTITFDSSYMGNTTGTIENRETSTITIDSSYMGNTTGTVANLETSTITVDSSFMGSTIGTVENRETSTITIDGSFMGNITRTIDNQETSTRTIDSSFLGSANDSHQIVEEEIDVVNGSLEEEAALTSRRELPCCSTNQVSNTENISSDQQIEEEIDVVNLSESEKVVNVDYIDITNEIDEDAPLTTFLINPARKRRRTRSRRRERNIYPEVIEIQDSPRVEVIQDSSRVEIIVVDDEEPPKKQPSLGNCPVCLEDLSKCEMMSTMCGHIFCSSCIRTVIKKNKKCPKCRKTLTLKSVHPLFF